jgi:hypothetical protein
MGGVEQTKVKYTHGGHTLRLPFEHPVSLDSCLILKFVAIPFYQDTFSQCLERLRS